MKKIHMHYAQYLQLPDLERSQIESTIVKTCKYYFAQGFSIPVSISKTYQESFFYITLVQKICRKNIEMKELFDARTYEFRHRKGFVK